MFKNEFKNLLVLTKGERNGILGLLILLFLLIIIRFLMPVFNKMAEEKELQNFEKDKKEFLAMVQIPDTANISYGNNPVSTKIIKNAANFPKKILYIEVNRADTNELMKLPGIGIVFSKRIIKYRQILGGFYAKQQIGEVYGVTDQLLKKISSSIYIDTSLIQKLDINSDEFKKINAHAYITYEQTKAIFDLRYKTKRKIDLEILEKTGIFDSATLQKIQPYLKFN